MCDSAQNSHRSETETHRGMIFRGYFFGMGCFQKQTHVPFVCSAVKFWSEIVNRLSHGAAKTRGNCRLCRSPPCLHQQCVICRQCNKCTQSVRRSYGLLNTHLCPSCQIIRCLQDWMHGSLHSSFYTSTSMSHISLYTYAILFFLFKTSNVINVRNSPNTFNQKEDTMRVFV